ncbi:MAG: vitamin B12-dependent ribonucleotide reductase [bacterium]|nr:vitamin B12-dependent ribonucleotide reductase [bacterium]
MSQATEASSITKTNSNNQHYALTVPRRFSHAGISPYDEVGWRTVKIKSHGVGGAMHERELEFPDFWSDSAAKIAGTKYFRGRIGSAQWESSARQMISRVVTTIRQWGLDFGYFKTKEVADTFGDELAAILINQRAAFNSPVWFNMGQETKPQCSACFILSVEDSMESILNWISTEGLIFKRGSGAGVNLSTLRSTKEKLTHGGHSSGPVSFMRGADSVAGMIASGGSTRRAAKMVIMNADHPDIMKFIRVKSEEEKKVKVLIEGGYDMYDLNNEAWNSIQYQNANNSVRVTDEFMRAVENDDTYSTRFVTNRAVAETFQARDLMRTITEAAWECGDPGMQYDTTINRWHTCPVAGRINASNPCSEYMFLDNTSCNLASINLMKYLGDDGVFDVAGFEHTVDVMFLAQEIIVGGASYPTALIEKNSIVYRPIGLGYANIGALLMSLGYAYDSEEGRQTAAAITALMTGRAYRESALIAKTVGPFKGYQANREPFLKVMNMHKDAVSEIHEELVASTDLVRAAQTAWQEAITFGRQAGFRNSQATVLAPTGTIALMMDCATTGVEPEFALVKNKQLVGGGTMHFVNTIVPRSLRRLGYTDSEITGITQHIEQQGTAEGAPGLKEEHVSVFDCAVKPTNGKRVISWKGHIKMVAAVQPFISGAISKTFNMSHDATLEEVTQAYIMGWKLGLKAVAVYRDGAKAAQPLQTMTGINKKENKAVEPFRRHLPATRPSETHKFSIAGHEGFLTYSMFENGDIGEIFISMSKQGSTLSGLLDAFAITISIALQYGVPLKTFAEKFSYGRFEPAGYTKNPDIQVATSITDYVFRYLALRFLKAEVLSELGIHGALPELEANGKEMMTASEGPAVKTKPIVYADSVCKACGGILIQTGSCKTCVQCGTSNGGC